NDATARIHLVAHSHGGNVALCAIELYLNYLQAKAEVVWNAGNGEGNCDIPTKYFRDENPEVSAFHLPPVQDSAITFGLGNWDLLRRRWDEAFAEFRIEIGVPLWVIPRRRQFMSWWQQSPTRNRLGRVVFMGTPFYFKR